MNQTFSLARFGRLLRKYLQDNRTSLLTGMGAVLVILATVAFFIIYTDYPSRVDNRRLISFLMILLVLWPLFTVQVTAVYNKREEGINALMLPASLFEKWLLLWLITGLGFLAWYTLCATLVDAVGTYYVNHRTWDPAVLKFLIRSKEPLQLDLIDYSILNESPIWAVWVLIHPFALAASLLFRRYTLVVGVFVGLVLFGGGLLVNSQILQSVVGSDQLINPIPFGGLTVNRLSESQSRNLELPQPLGNLIRYGVCILAIALLYAVAFFRLKEREI
jgi:hypothetical protein